MYKKNCSVIGNEKIAPGHWMLKLRSRDIAAAARPGQFVQILCAHNSYDPLLGRPFSFLAAKKDVFSILYHMVGKGTELLSKVKKGDALDVIGPLGKGFNSRPQTADRRRKTNIFLVGGGVGIPPLYHLAETLIKNKAANIAETNVMLGARHKTLLLCEKEFKKLGVNVFIATDDGSKGHRGFITELLNRSLQSPVSSLQSQIYSCGPTQMLKAVSAISEKYKVPCEVSVEVPMACGFGACLGCAIKVRQQTADGRLQTKENSLQSPASSLQSGFRFAIACTEGPVFKSSEILWD